MAEDWEQQLVQLKDGTKLVTTVYSVQSDSTPHPQEGLIMLTGTWIPVSCVAAKGEIRLWQERDGRSDNPLTMVTLQCSHCGSTDHRSWVWVQYVRVNYGCLEVGDHAITMINDLNIEYESVLAEALCCHCGADIDHGKRRITFE